MAGLKVPIVTLIMGEGGSGGALGVGMGNRVGMLSRAYFGVVSAKFLCLACPLMIYSSFVYSPVDFVASLVRSVFAFVCLVRPVSLYFCLR